ncbi:MAG TPA: peptidoglycan-binding domain-containing protein [Reyranella sp.]|nr:peptidoglycan-binding domain-containing protein [Reyranella sp.]
MGRWLLLGALIACPLVALHAQSAGEVERCFQNPAGCSSSAAQPPPAPAAAPAPMTASRTAPAPDYTSVLQSPEPDRRKIQESLRTLDKYNGPIDGNLQSEATMKAITQWQKGHGYAQVGKLTPTEAQTLNAEAARAPIKRLDPSTQAASAAPHPAAPQSNADALKALQARLAARRKAAEPKANAGAEALIKDLKAYIAADGKGVAGEQFTGFAKWYADNKAAGRTIGAITPAIDDFGDGKMGDAETAEVKFETRQGEQTYGQCLVFAWIEGSPRKNTQAFSCDDVAAVEKWKTEQALKSAWR